MKRSNGKQVFIGVTFAALILIIITILATIVITSELNKRRQIAKIILPVAVQKPIKGEIRQSVTINGYINNESTVDVIPMAQGTLLQLHVREGQTVRKGQRLATIDSSALKVQKAQAESAYQTAKSAFDRVEALYKENLTSKQDYETAKNMLAGAKAQNDAVQLQLDYTNVTAPIDGKVLIIITKEGSIASPQMPLMRISNPKTIAVTNALPEKYYEQFAEARSKMEVFVHRPGSDTPPAPAYIFSVSDYIDFQSKTFVVKSSFGQRPPNWVPGMFVKTEFVLKSKKNIYMLPFELLVAGERLWIVERSEENPEMGTARMISFIPEFFNADSFEIPEEFASYEFVCEGQEFLYEGESVRIIDRQQEAVK
ncbi:MAG: efflux RND transporter periplasmic adaptor subunit [Spirochaetia bacterium]|nr:efflux RND transporter periplasmic adaptor subunit [Spirochaetia bacterium]